MKPQPWQVLKLTTWHEQDKKERADREAKHLGERHKAALYERYRLQCIPYKFLVIANSPEHVDKAIRTLNQSYEKIFYKVLEISQEKAAIAIVSCEDVHMPDWTALFDVGWRPFIPSLLNRIREGRRDG